MNLSKIKQQEKRLEKEKEKALAKMEGRIILGFRLYRYIKRQGKRNLSYPYWQAGKHKNGQKLYIYVGTDPHSARRKILEYFEKNPEKREIFAETLTE